MINEKSPSFADVICDLRKRKVKSKFLDQMNTLLSWDKITNIINKHYSKGKSATGQPAYSGELLFKMCLLQTWYGLSDYEVEERLNDSIAFSNFCGMSLEEVAPDHSTLCRFRKEMNEKHVFEELFQLINKQLEENKIIVKKGCISDASVTDSPFKPKGKAQFEIEQDRSKEQRNTEELEKEKAEKQLQKAEKPGIDNEAAWLKRGNTLRYGYKKHVLTDEEGLILGLITTPANVNEIKMLGEILDKVDLPHGIPCFADKGYASKENDEIVKKKGLKNRILKKAAKARPLKAREKLFNTMCGKVRYKIERTFGSIKLWFNSGKARYYGQIKMNGQNLMEAMCYNLYRSPGIIMSRLQKN